MRKNLLKIYLLIPMAFFLVVLFAFNPLTASTSYAAAATSTSSTWVGVTTGAANVRISASTSSTRVATYAQGTHVTVYATVTGQVVWSGIRSWYRISSLASAPRYIYGGLVAHASTSSGSGGPPPATSSAGKVIVVSLSQQKLYAYDNGKVVYTSLVTTGRPQLATPTGTFHIFRKLQNVTFTSPWPKSSPYYYSPEHVDFALQITWSGIYLHDSPWRSVYGPGTEGWHYDPKLGWGYGSHGCVNMPYSASKWLYQWAPIGTTVKVVS